MTYDRPRAVGRGRALTRGQVKALLRVASDGDLPSPTWARRSAAVANVRIAEMSRVHGCPVDDAIRTAMNAATSVTELSRMKELAKVLIRDAADDRRSREAATLLYHVAVAAALVHHDAAISGRPLRGHEPLYEMFAATWDGHPIGALFRQAAARVRTR